MSVSYTVYVERVLSQPIAIVRRRVLPGDLARVVPEACGVVWNAVKAAKVTNTGRNIAIYRHAGNDLLDLEVGVEVGSAFQGHSTVVGSVTPAGDAATTTHYGPYGNLGEAHHAIRHWCDAAGRTIDGTSWEVYGHWLQEWNTHPSKIRTDVFYLLKN